MANSAILPSDLAAPVLPAVDDPRTRVAPLATVRSGALVAGLCAGLARWLHFDALLLRVALAVVTLLALILWWPLSLAIGCLYVLAWIALPREDAIPWLDEFEF